jgi:hypothetical protein
MIRRTLKKKPSLVKNKTGKRKNTKGIKRNRRKVHKTRKRKGGKYHSENGFRVLTYDNDGLHSDVWWALKAMGKKFMKMSEKTRNKYRKLRDYIQRQNKGGTTYKGGEKEGEKINDLIKNINDGDDRVSPCDHIEPLRQFLELAENEETKTALTNKINELEHIGKCENTGSETTDPGSETTKTETTEPSEEAEEEEEPTEEV